MSNIKGRIALSTLLLSIGEGLDEVDGLVAVYMRAMAGNMLLPDGAMLEMIEKSMDLQHEYALANNLMTDEMEITYQGAKEEAEIWKEEL